MADLVLSKVLSSYMRVRQEDGTFIPVFPFSTLNEVYYDIDHQVKMADIIDTFMNIIETDTMSTLYELTPVEVEIFNIVHVKAEDRYFFVKDTDKLKSSDGYLEILTPNRFGVGNGVAQLDKNMKIRMENILDNEPYAVLVLDGDAKVPMVHILTNEPSGLPTLNNDNKIPMDKIITNEPDGVPILNEDNKLSVEYLETNKPGGVVIIDPDGRIPQSIAPKPIEFITYVESDIS